MFDSLWPNELQYARLPCPSPSPGVCSNSCPLSQWCHPTISSSCRPLLLLPPIFPSIRVFSSKSVLHIRWPKYGSFSFSISPSNEYSGLISFRIPWFDLCVVQGTFKGLFWNHSSTTTALLNMPKPLTKPWKILKDIGIPDHLACLLRNLYTAQEATVRI